MKYFNFNTIYTIIDIGTTKICVIIAQKKTEEKIDILGVGIVPSEGLSHGVVVEIPLAAESIKKALNEAQIMASIEPEAAFIGISGSHIKSYYSQGMTQIKEELITENTIQEALSASCAIPLSEDEKLLHSIPISYTIDGLATVQNPLGMHGMRLEVSSHIITANINSIKDLIHCCSIAGIKTQDIILEPIASGEAILSEEEKKLGALLIDIGGGTSDVALYQKGSLLYTEILPIAGNTFTNDLSICLKTPFKEAENLKREFGIISENLNLDFTKILELDGKNYQEVPVDLIQEILAARAAELSLIVEQIISKYNPIYSIPSGIVLTGGGSLLNGLPKIIENLLKVKTRIGYPNVEELYKNILEHPSFATSYGLLLYAIKITEKPNLVFSEKDSSFSKVLKKLKNFIDNFI